MNDVIATHINVCWYQCISKGSNAYQKENATHMDACYKVNWDVD